ncbi:MAG: pseudouridine synthase [Fibrobacterota bacterium]
MEEAEKPVRLNRYLASCGLGSRRGCDRLIAENRIRINGRPAQQGEKIVPRRDRVFCNGRAVGHRLVLQYLAYYKPRGVIVSAADPHNPHTIYDDLKKKGIEGDHLRYAGRLDKDSEGVLILSNDGDFIYSLTHPRFHVEKTYRVLISRPLPSEHICTICSQGVYDSGEYLRADSVRKEQSSKQGVWYTIVLHEGKNRHIRRIISYFGARTLKLIRIQFGSVKAQDIPEKGYFYLTENEAKSLKIPL